MNEFKTPGVYIVERSVLPESVSGVSTAIPAFIGYTEKAGVDKELFYKPTRVTSLNNYVEQFGAPTETINVEAKDDELTLKITEPKKLMYYGMQMFFANGGESCYIVALDENNDDPTVTELQKYMMAVDALELEDEPTLIVLVDRVNMENADD